MSLSRAFNKLETSVVVTSGVGSASTSKLNGNLRFVAIQGLSGSQVGYTLTQDGYQYDSGTGLVTGQDGVPKNEIPLDGVFVLRVTSDIDGTYKFLFVMD